MSTEIMTDRGTWDNFIDKSPSGMLFHKWDFLKAIEKHTGFDLRPYGIFKGSELIALFPLFIRKHIGMAMVFSPPPLSRVPYLGFVLSPGYDRLRQRGKELYMKLIKEGIAGQLAGISRIYTRFALVPGFTDIRQFLWNGYTPKVNFTYVIDLRRPVEHLWKDLEKEARAEINKETYIVRESKDVSTFYRIMKERYSEQNLNYTIAGEQYVADLLAAYPDNLKMFFAYAGDDVKGVRIDCMYKDRYIEWMGGVNLHRGTHPNEFIRWHCITEAKKMGYRIYELSGADAMRLCHNKNKFNPVLDICLAVDKKALAGEVAESVYRAVIKNKVL